MISRLTATLACLAIIGNVPAFGQQVTSTASARVLANESAQLRIANPSPESVREQALARHDRTMSEKYIALDDKDARIGMQESSPVRKVRMILLEQQ